MPATLAPAAVLATEAPPTLENFGGDPFWLLLLKVIGVFVFLVGMTLFMIVWERKAVARMQQRKGPNRTGPQGSLQSLADGFKLALKEEIIPALADKPVYVIAPILSAVPAFMAFAVIPLGPEVSIFGNRTPLQMTDLPVGVLFVLAMASVGVYGIILAGWASGSTYPLLGSLRSAAQVISYEVGLGLALVPVFLFTGSLSTSEIVAAQSRDFLWGIPFWNVILLPSFAIYVVSAVGETNRAPFDLPEAESELVGGFHTEYTSLKFAMFFLAEYINMVTVSAVAVTLFLGGWLPPWPLNQFEWASTGWVPIIWFTLKLLAMLFTFIWLRGTLPRLRYDQFMKFGWKFLIPVALGWIVVVAVVRGLQVSGYDLMTRLLVVLVLVSVLYLVFELVQRARYKPPPTAEETQETARGLGTYPVPELPVAGQVVFRGPGSTPLRAGDGNGGSDGGDSGRGQALPAGTGARAASSKRASDRTTSDRAGRS